MKKLISLGLVALTILASVPLSACTSNTSDTPTQTQTPATSLVLVKDGKSDFKIIRPNKAISTSPERKAALTVKDAILNATGVEVERDTDTYQKSDPAAVKEIETAKEILIGHTNRKETQEAIKDLKSYEYIVKAIGNKLVICGGSENATQYAAEFFATYCVTAGATSLEIALDYEYKGIIDMNTSSVHNLYYEQMGATILNGFADVHIDRRGKIINTEFWDTAEIMEAMLDAYEQTGHEAYLTYAENIAIKHFSADNPNADHMNNMYNDDLAWMIIGLTRLYNFTQKESYLSVAKNTFDQMYARAYSPDVLGGGLWWKQDSRQTKNSCIQCPASIAACLLGKTLGDDSYYEKAKETMEWQINTLFNPKNGQVYDAINIKGGCDHWASSYNQGTFVGACTLLYEKYGEQRYMDYATKAVGYGMYNLANKNGVLSGEDSSNDNPGFKGILTRWFYRYAVFTDDMNVLVWLQKNADAAYGNRNQYNLIWSDWSKITEDTKDLDPWGCVAAVALLFNCEPWW